MKKKTVGVRLTDMELESISELVLEGESLSDCVRRIISMGAKGLLEKNEPTLELLYERFAKEFMQHTQAMQAIKNERNGLKSKYMRLGCDADELESIGTRIVKGS
jgi:predicted RNase H-like nuclease (RuvC/YqgF family)